MIINSIIRYLQTDDELIINRLGRFSKKNVASQVEGSMITPPKVILEFEYNEDGNGFSLIDKISKWESLRLLDADDAVTKWVQELKTAVQNNKSVAFENFGTFSINPDGKMVFESDIIKELNGEFYGMNPVPVLKSDKITIEPEFKEEPVEIKEEPMEFKEEPVEIKQEPMEFKEENTDIENSSEELIIIKPKRKSRWLETILFIIIILGSLALVGYLFRKEIKQFYQDQFQKTEIVTPATQPIPSQQDINSDEMDESEDATEMEANEPMVEQPKPVVETPKTPTPDLTPTKPVQSNQPVNSPSGYGEYKTVSIESGKFYVIAGSFVNQQDAIKHIREKKLGTYNPVLVIGQSRVRVCIGIFKTEAEATAYATKIDKTYWVLK